MRESVKAAGAIPADIIGVGIIERAVFGVTAHHAQCLVPGCGQRSAAMDPRADGQPHGTVMRWADRHGKKHAEAADRAAAEQEG